MFPIGLPRLVFNILGVARAVLQTSLSLIYKLTHCLPLNIQINFNPKAVTYHVMLCVKCYVSHVTCRMIFFLQRVEAT